jgi:hypothetical protein
MAPRTLPAPPDTLAIKIRSIMELASSNPVDHDVNFMIDAILGGGG